MGKNCENCKHVHEPYERSICRICDVTDLRVHLGHAKHTKWEPKEEPEEEKYCCDCKHVHTSDLDIPCAICNGHSKFEPKEEQKMSDVKEVLFNGKPIPEGTPAATVSGLGKAAVFTLMNINEKLRMIEQFVGHGTTELGNWGGEQPEPKNLMENLKTIGDMLTDINARLGLLQELL